MGEDELLFLARKIKKENRAYIRFFLFMLVPSIVFSYPAAIQVEKIELPNSFIYEREYFSYEYYFLILGCLVCIFLFAILVNKNVSDNAYIRKDVKAKEKVVECATILSKKYMSYNNTCYLFLNSIKHYSIAVSHEDYEIYKEGDEINIEYSLYGNVFFGYF